MKRVMLAAAVPVAAIRYPCLVSYKLDGIRMVCSDGRLLTRSMKPIPNRFINALLPAARLAGLDGEITVGNPHAADVYNRTMSGVMSAEGQPEFTWRVFDDFSAAGGYARRAHQAKKRVQTFQSIRVAWVPQEVIRSPEELLALEERVLAEGYEGLILRDPRGPYKQGRSTPKEGYMLKLKRFVDAEAEVIGYVEQEHNENEATLDERGYTKRSTAKSGKVAAGMLGALEVRDVTTGVEFQIGTGFTQDQRINLWQGRKYLVGKLVKYKSFPIGVKDKPRFPTFLGFRSRRDM